MRRVLCKLGGGARAGSYLRIDAEANEIVVPVSCLEAPPPGGRLRVVAAHLERYHYCGTQHGVRFYRVAEEAR